MIIKAGVDMGVPALKELADASAEPEIVKTVASTLEKLCVSVIFADFCESTAPQTDWAHLDIR